MRGRSRVTSVHLWHVSASTTKLKDTDLQVFSDPAAVGLLHQNVFPRTTAELETNCVHARGSL